MHRLLLFTLATCLTWAAPSDLVAQALSSRATPKLPSKDPFYLDPPAGYEKKAPGTILRHRPVPAPITIGNNGTLHVKAAYQILYRTTDAVGRPEAALTTLLIPQNPDYRKVLSYQFAYDSSSINCSPSYTLQQGADTSNGTTTSGAESLLIKAALNQGWIVNTPDYEGPKAAFVAGPQAAYATLDSVRAVLKSGSFSKVSPHARYAMWGYSGGCLASGWASEIQPSYAKDLNFIGAACGGLVPNVTSILYTIDNGPFAGLGPAGTMGLGQAYQNLSRYIDANLVPATATKFKRVLYQCESKDSSDFQFQELFKYFKKGKRSLQDPIPKSVLNIAGQQGQRHIPTMPLYYYKAIGDEISPVADSDALYHKLCKGGANIHYVRDAAGEHVSEAILGSPGALGWLKDRFDGIPAPKGCMVEPVTISALDPSAAKILGPLVYAALVGELGDPSFFPGR